MNLALATDLFKLLGDPTRVRLMSLLEGEELTVAELTRITRLAQSRVSTHLGRLREANLLRDRKAGASTYYSVNPSMPAAALSAWALVRDSAEDPLLDQDAERLKERHRTWADAVAGQMERHYSPGRTWQATLRGLLGLLKLGHVLDVASGDCALAELIAPRATTVTCLDSSATVLKAGRRRLRHLDGRVGFRRGDMHALPFPDATFDHVLLLACLSYAADPQRAVAEAARVLKPGGDLVAVTLRKHGHQELVERYDQLQYGFEVEPLRAMLSAAGLDIALCEVTSRERRSPHLEVITVHASR